MTAWSDERIYALEEMWKAGQTASQIAAALGGTTRNAVLGKIHRLNLSGRAKPPAPAKSKPPRAAAAPKPRPAPMPRMAPPRRRVKPAPIPPADEPAASWQVRLIDSNDLRCKWPIGDANGPDTIYCGFPKEGEQTGPYCRHHAARSAGRGTASERRAHELARAPQ